MSKESTLLPTLKINYLTEEQYSTALANGEIDENELYMTPGFENIFLVEYGVTTFSQALEAYSNRQQLLMYEDNADGRSYKGVLSYIQNEVQAANRVFVFSCIENGKEHRYALWEEDGRWTHAIYDYQTGIALHDTEIKVLESRVRSLYFTSGYSFSDFNLADQTLEPATGNQNTSGENATVTASGLDKSVFEGYLNFATDTPSLFVKLQFGALVFFTPNGNHRLLVGNPLNNSVYFYTDKVTENFGGKDMRLTVEFEKVNKGVDYKISVYINFQFVGSHIISGGVAQLDQYKALVIQSYAGYPLTIKSIA